MEDFDLWTRAVEYTKFETLPQVYGEYRISSHNISQEKVEAIELNMCEIVRCQLSKKFDITVPDEYVSVLNG
ncbi:MAG: hypothetical protein LIO96_00265 [Lachnospiraceae bacterium]|nr:hypothetical protein [Lachnospiraceae bacterium]